MYKKHFYLFLGGASLVFGMVILYPFLIGFGYSFTSWHLSYFESEIFVGLRNYVKIFTIPEFRDSLLNTAFLVLICLVVQISAGLALAILISNAKAFGGFSVPPFSCPTS